MDKIDTTSKFIKQIVAITGDMEKENESDHFWFRGESSVEFQTPLVPDAYRVLAKELKKISNRRLSSDNIKSIERNVQAEFYRKAAPYLAEGKIESTKANRYFLMQHYGIPTRLLDWSENALIPLYFSVKSEVKKNADAVVWILDPFELNNFTISKILGNENATRKIILSISNNYKRKGLFNKQGEFRHTELTRRYMMMDFQNKDPENELSYFPLAIYPPYIDKRIQAQYSCFTLFGNEIMGLTIPENEKWMKKVIIDGKSKNNILKELSLLGISENTISPDIYGLSKAIRNKFAKDYNETAFELIKHFDSVLKKSNNKKTLSNEKERPH